jgi:hypothetical protein
MITGIPAYFETSGQHPDYLGCSVNCTRTGPILSIPFSPRELDGADIKVGYIHVVISCVTLRHKQPQEQNVKDELDDSCRHVPLLTCVWHHKEGLTLFLSYATLFIWSLQRLCTMSRCVDCGSGFAFRGRSSIYIFARNIIMKAIL